MQAYPVQIRNLKDLRDYVQQELCQQNELEVGAFPLHRTRPGKKRSTLRDLFLPSRPAECQAGCDLGNQPEHHPFLRLERRTCLAHPTLSTTRSELGTSSTTRGCEKMGLAPSGNGENPGKSAVAKVPVPIFSQPRQQFPVRGGSDSKAVQKGASVVARNGNASRRDRYGMSSAAAWGQFFPAQPGSCAAKDDERRVRSQIANKCDRLTLFEGVLSGPG
jgi:hypothetical protein